MIVGDVELTVRDLGKNDDQIDARDVGDERGPERDGDTHRARLPACDS